MDIKFEFTLDFQFDLIRFTLKDKRGLKVLKLYTPNNFIDTNHAILINVIKGYVKKKKKPPSETLFREELNDWFKSKESEDLNEDDRKELYKLLKELYDKPLIDSDEIYEKASQFAAYIKVKEEIDNFNLYSFKDYEPFANKVLKAIKIGNDLKEEKGTYLISDIHTRQFNRQDINPIVPTPFRQINKLTNAGGYDKGSIIVVLDKPKQLKTTLMVNVVRGYLRMKRKVAYFDLENGQDNIAMRLEESVSNLSKHELLSGEQDSKVQRVLRKYKRLGGEVFIKRVPNGTTANGLKAILDDEHRETGFKPEILIIDYIGLMGSISGNENDALRISEAYTDVANLALEMGIEHIWSPHHVKNEAFCREKTKYQGNDFAKCIEIGRHVHAVYGLNRNDTEKDNGVVRMELVMQRDGQQDGRAFFWGDIDGLKTQRLTEFTKLEREGYNIQIKGERNEKNKDSGGDI